MENQPKQSKSAPYIAIPNKPEDELDAEEQEEKTTLILQGNNEAGKRIRTRAKTATSGNSGILLNPAGLFSASSQLNQPKSWLSVRLEIENCDMRQQTFDISGYINAFWNWPCQNDLMQFDHLKTFADYLPHQSEKQKNKDT
eukprot:283104_1